MVISHGDDVPDMYKTTDQAGTFANLMMKQLFCTLRLPGHELTRATAKASGS